MYKILLVGHGLFPRGIKNAIELILGRQKNLFTENISKEKGHNYFEDKVTNFILKNENIIVIADLTGGAPHQICVRKAIENKTKNIFIVSGISLSFLIELLLTNNLKREQDQDEKLLKNILGISKDMAKIIKV